MKRTFGKGSNTATLRDIAEALRLSVSTVSAALQKRADISVRTRQRVLKKAQELQYRPNWLARALVTRRTQVLGVVVPDLSRSFFTEVSKGIDTVASAAGYNLVICNTGEDEVREVAELTSLVSRQVDGLILASAHRPGSTDVIRWLARTNIPFVLIDRYFAGANFVGGDDEKIGFLATSHLIRQGYRRIAHIRGPHIWTALGRLKGYQRALRQRGLRPRADYVVEAQYHEESSGYEAMQKLLQLSPRPDAIFAGSDPMAIGALEAARAAGLRLPEDMGLIGVGNARYTQYLSVPLSTVDQQRDMIGKKAAGLLLDLINRKRPPTRPKVILLEPRLIIRESSRRVPLKAATAAVSSAA
jgi:LacI family transcriptional regulator